MSKKRTTYSKETKAAAMAALLTGQSVSAVAREYKIPKGTVSGWKYQSAKHVDITTQKKPQIGDMLAEYLTETLITLKAQAIFMRTEEWLRKQPASELAVLHGVQTDKAIRLLEAMGNAGNSD